ncbi:MAG: FtsQ-type POTRA domain-containing protein [Bryobacteraceae bacterium]
MAGIDDADGTVESMSERSPEPRIGDAKSRSRARGDRARTPRPAAGILRAAMRFTVAAALLVGALFALQSVERFLIQDPRFALLEPADSGAGSPSLHLMGLHYTSKTQVMRVFAPDFDRSVYLLPLAARRRQLLAIDWVKDATIARVWPDQVTVRITERRPVAFVALAAGDGRSRMALIDRDAVILETPPKSRFALPVLTGFAAGDSQPVRRERVRRMERLLTEVGPLGARISEIDTTDRDNIRVTVDRGDRALVLLLGDRNFAPRLENFMNHYGEIQKRLPHAATLDMRLEDRITVVE